MENLTQWWQGVMAIPGAAWIIYPSLLVVLILVAWYVLLALRNMALGGAPSTDDHLGSFRKMRDEGVLDSEEYKRLAGMVPMPELESKTPVTDSALASGQDALAEAAKDALRKAAHKRSAGESGESGDSQAAGQLGSLGSESSDGSDEDSAGENAQASDS